MDADVLIRTLPLSSGNIGGALQAFAMQRMLEDLGATCVTDVSVRLRARSRVRHAGRWLAHMGSNRAAAAAHELAPRHAAVSAFVADHIATTRVFGSGADWRPSPVEGRQYYLSGSDQVFRPAYCNVPSYLFDFLTDEQATRAFTYAGSFGRRDDDEYSPAQRRATRLAAQRLRGISVREPSTVDVATGLWHREIHHHVDPTMLVETDVYRQLAEPWSALAAKGPTVVTYLLEPLEVSPDVMGADVLDAQANVHEIGTHQALGGSRATAPPAPADRSGGVEAWLASMMSADFIITDSFHGSVFAILFERDFIMVDNPGRGSARLADLAQQFNLSGRLFERSSANDAIDLLFHRQLAAIDWKAAALTRAAARARAIRYLRQMLDLPMLSD